MTNNISKTGLIDVRPNKNPLYFFSKRVFDVFSSALCLIIFSPVFIIVAIVIIIDDPGNPFFIQERDGLNGKIFKMYKFRSMCKDAPKMRAAMEKDNELDGPAFKMSNDPRITRVGKILRKTSLDELPQLANIFMGNMSVVGPRPLPTYETAQLSSYQRQRLLVKPGLICYWQIRGRSNTTFDQWIEMDFDYINHASLWTDLKIIIEAVPAVLKGDGAS